jgi:hypothetical protein
MALWQLAMRFFAIRQPPTIATPPTIEASHRRRCHYTVILQTSPPPVCVPKLGVDHTPRRRLHHSSYPRREPPRLARQWNHAEADRLCVLPVLSRQPPPGVVLLPKSSEDAYFLG